MQNLPQQVNGLLQVTSINRLQGIVGAPCTLGTATNARVRSIYLDDGWSTDGLTRPSSVLAMSSAMLLHALLPSLRFSVITLLGRTALLLRLPCVPLVSNILLASDSSYRIWILLAASRSQLLGKKSASKEQEDIIMILTTHTICAQLWVVCSRSSFPWSEDRLLSASQRAARSKKATCRMLASESLALLEVLRHS